MKKQALNVFTDGLVTDYHPLTAKNTILTDALNATLVTIKGNEMVLLNDVGNLKIPEDGSSSEYVKISEGFIPIGIKEYLGVLYIVSLNEKENLGEIGTYPSPGDSNNLVKKYKPLDNLYQGSTKGEFTSKYFNFKLTNPVDILIQPSYDGSVNLILNDGTNIPRLINSGFAVLPDSKYQIPNRTRKLVYSNDTLEDFDVTTSLVLRISRYPKIEYNGVLNTGNLPVGNYVLYFKYADVDGNETDFIGESSIISIFKGKDKDPFSIDGGVQDMDSNKSIQITLSNVDKNYTSIKVYYSRTSSAMDSNRIPMAYAIDKKYEINDNNVCHITITGDENTLTIPLSELNSQYFIADSAATSALCLNMLFLGNIEATDPNYVNLTNLSLYVVPYGIRQKSTPLIGLVSTKDYVDPDDKYEYYNTLNIYNYVGYWNEEYYRLGIVYIFNNGQRSNVYNIAGREFNWNRAMTLGATRDYDDFKAATSENFTNDIENVDSICSISKIREITDNKYTYSADGLPLPEPEPAEVIPYIPTPEEILEDPTVIDDIPYIDDRIVDLGLPSGTKWASMNIGASNIYDSGDLIGWGDPTGTNLSTNNWEYATGHFDDSDICATDVDTAHVKWGGYWRMPTIAELEELTSKCKYERYQDYPIGNTGLTFTGYKLTGPNGNYIFIPAAGYRSGNLYVELNRYTFLWTGQEDPESGNPAGYRIVSGYSIRRPNPKYLGFGIRPVWDLPTNHVVQTHKDLEVDLGLSVKWCSCNLGASSDTGLGGFYAWGETEAKEHHSMDNYTLAESKSNYYDIGNVIPLEYDAARNNMGGYWRIPTDAEMGELVTDCTWTRTTKDGVDGYTVTGPNGNSIFMRIDTGISHSNDMANVDYGFYWTANIYQRYNNFTPGTKGMALAFEFKDYIDPLEISYQYKEYGLQIRPVTDEEPAYYSYFDTNRRRAPLRATSNGSINSEIRNDKGVVHFVDNQETDSYIYSIGITLPDNFNTILKRLGIKGYFFVRQKRIPTIACQGYTLPWDKEAKVPIVEYWDKRVMPIGWNVLNDNNHDADRNKVWHTSWNEGDDPPITTLNSLLTEMRCYFVEGFLAHFGDSFSCVVDYAPGDSNLKKEFEQALREGKVSGVVFSRAIIHNYKARLNDILRLTIDAPMISKDESVEQSIDSDNTLYRIKRSEKYALPPEITTALLYDYTLAEVIKETLHHVSSMPELVSNKDYAFYALETYGNPWSGMYAIYHTPELRLMIVNFASCLIDVSVLYIICEDQTYGTPLYTFNSLDDAMNLLYVLGHTSGNGVLYRKVDIAVTRDGNTIHTTIGNYNSTTDLISIPEDGTSADAVFYVLPGNNFDTYILENPNEFEVVSTYTYSLDGYINYNLYFRDLYFNTDGSIINSGDFSFVSPHKKDFCTSATTTTKPFRLGNQYSNFLINSQKGKEYKSYTEDTKDRIWTPSMLEHFYNLYKYCDGNLLTAICPEFEVRQPFYNSLFTGSKYKVKYILNLQGVLHRNPNNERLYYPKVEENDYFQTTPFPSSLDYKICSVTDNVPVVAIDNTIFKSVLGSDAEAYRFEFINEEHAGKQCWRRDEGSGSDTTYYTSEGHLDWNLARGIFSPYLGIVALKTADGITEKERGYCKTFNIYYTDELGEEFLNPIRYLDNSSYGTISDIYQIDDNNSKINLFRGDCYLCTFTHRLNRNFNDPVSPTNDKILDAGTWYFNYYPNTEASTTKSSDRTVEGIERLNQINRGDINAVKLGSWITIKVKSSYNLSIRSLDESHILEVGVMGRARGFYPLQLASADGGYKIPNSYVINDGFGSTLSEKWYNTIQDAQYLKNNFTNRIAYSNITGLDLFINGYRVFRGTNWIDYTNQYGAIVKILEFYSNLICVFEHGVAVIPVKERALVAEGNGGEVFINNSKVIPDTLNNVVSDMYGSLWADSVIKTPYYIYGVDASKKKIWRFGRTFDVISDFSVEKFLLDNIVDAETKSVPIIGLKNVVTHYNANKSDVMFTFYWKKCHADKIKPECLVNHWEYEYLIDEDAEDILAWNLCYNEILLKFLTFYSWVPLISENIGNEFYSFDQEYAREQIIGKEKQESKTPRSTVSEKDKNDNATAILKNFGDSKLHPYIWKHGEIDGKFPYPCFWYDEQHPFEFEFVVNESAGVHKMFDNLVIISNLAEPESFHFTIVGDTYEFKEDKPNMYYRLEATKEMFNRLGSNITYNEDYTELTPRLLKQSKSTVFPLYYKRVDTPNDIYDSYTRMLDASRDYRGLTGSEVSWDKLLDEFNITSHLENIPIDSYWKLVSKAEYDSYTGKKKIDRENFYYILMESNRLRGNSQYREDAWLVLIAPMTLMQKNEDWTDKPPIVVNTRLIAEDLSNDTIDENVLPNTYDIADIDATDWTYRKEAKIRDKYCKIRVRYNGVKLAIISAIITTFTISYS